jgi:nitrogen fixation NifU-like protein
MEKEEQHETAEDPSLQLLSERFLAHVNSPRNFGRLEPADGQARGVGTCGDSIEIFLAVNGQRIKEVRHIPNGCAYTIACASAVTTLVSGRSLEEILKLTADDLAAELGGLPEDHRHCAALAINTLGEAVDDYYQKIWGQKARPSIYRST